MPINETFDKFFSSELSRDEWQSILASNAVLEWFGKTFRGKKEIASFYTGSNYNYRHFMSSPKPIPAFESRPTHLSTRLEPEENFIQPLQVSEVNEEESYQEHTQSSLDMSVKESLYCTPPQRPNAFIECPPAPCRRSLLNSSSEQLKDFNSDESESDDNESVSGIRSLDHHSSIHLKHKPRRGRIRERALKRTRLEQTISSATSNYSDLSYLHSNGDVLVRSTSSTFAADDEDDRRVANLFISYRTHKENPDDIQIALIVYRSVNSRPRRNLAEEFLSDAADDSAISLSSTPISLAASPLYNESSERMISSRIEFTTPSSAFCEQSKRATKRPIKPRGCLRF